MEKYRYITLMEKPELKEEAAAWFHSKWGVPQEAYLECMNTYLNNETNYGWEFFCMVRGDGCIYYGTTYNNAIKASDYYWVERTANSKIDETVEKVERHFGF